jgi:hemerythrin-like domain-containing protein
MELDQNHTSSSAATDRQHPFSVLMAEHAVILGVLDSMERECLDLAEGKELRQAFWRRALLFHSDFADGMHHDREEKLLFPALEHAGLTRSGPTTMLRQEHERGRAWRQRLGSAIAMGDGLRVQAASAGFIDFQRQHIQKENQILFPLARQLLSPETIAELRIAFQALDQEHGMKNQLQPMRLGIAD